MKAKEAKEAPWPSANLTIGRRQRRIRSIDEDFFQRHAWLSERRSSFFVSIYAAFLDGTTPDKINSQGYHAPLRPTNEYSFNNKLTRALFLTLPRKEARDNRG